MKALSIRAPWWWFILHGSKRLENRSRCTSYRGPVLIHASQWWSQRAVVVTLGTLPLDLEAEFLRAAQTMPPEDFRMPLSQFMQSRRGMIVGRADIIDCIDSSDDPWWIGPHAYVLARPVAFATPIPFKGRLGLFDVPDEMVPEARAA